MKPGDCTYCHGSGEDPSACPGCVEDCQVCEGTGKDQAARDADVLREQVAKGTGRPGCTYYGDAV